MRSGYSVRMVYPRGCRSIPNYVGGSISEDRGFKIKPCELSKAVSEFKSNGGKVKVITPQDLEGLPLPKIGKRKGWKGVSHGEKAGGIKGEVE